MRARKVNIGIGFNTFTVEEMVPNASKPVKFNFTGMKLLIAHKKYLLCAKLWHKRRFPNSYLFAFLKL